MFLVLVFLVRKFLVRKVAEEVLVVEELSSSTPSNPLNFAISRNRSRGDRVAAADFGSPVVAGHCSAIRGVGDQRQRLVACGAGGCDWGDDLGFPRSPRQDPPGHDRGD